MGAKVTLFERGFDPLTPLAACLVAATIPCVDTITGSSLSPNGSGNEVVYLEVVVVVFAVVGGVDGGKARGEEAGDDEDVATAAAVADVAAP